MKYKKITHKEKVKVIQKALREGKTLILETYVGEPKISDIDEIFVYVNGGQSITPYSHEINDLYRQAIKKNATKKR